MDFFDEDDSPQADQPRRAPARGRAASRERHAGGQAAPSREQIRARRLVLFGGAIVVFILLVLAIRGCLDARKERGFQNYVRDLSAITAETDQLSNSFFGAFAGEGGNGDISLTNQINGERGTIQNLLSRARNLDTPDELGAAQSQVVLSYELRNEAIENVADLLPAALGDEGSNKATKEIAEQMRVLLASDVLYSRARSDIEAVIAEQEVAVGEDVPKSEFLPTGKNAPNYLELSEVQAAISGAGGTTSGDAGPADDGLRHGLGLASVVALPAGVPLQTGAPTTVSPDGLELEVQVQNQGEASESGVEVSVDGGGISGSATIKSIAEGETQSVTIPIRGASSGDSASITVSVATVPGEQVAENNEQTYELTFQ